MTLAELYDTAASGDPDVNAMRDKVAAELAKQSYGYLSDDQSTDDEVEWAADVLKYLPAEARTAWFLVLLAANNTNGSLTVSQATSATDANVSTYVAEVVPQLVRARALINA